MWDRDQMAEAHRGGRVAASSGGGHVQGKKVELDGLGVNGCFEGHWAPFRVGGAWSGEPPSIVNPSASRKVRTNRRPELPTIGGGERKESAASIECGAPVRIAVGG